VTRIIELGTTLVVTSNQHMLRRNKKNKKEVFLRNMHRLLATANAVPSSPILVTLMTEALHFSKMSVLTRATQCNIQEDGILQLVQSWW
jgi:hypothetical protein